MASVLGRALSAFSTGLLRPALSRLATKKAGGSSNARTSKPKYLGIKIYGDQFAKAGAIIMRQRGGARGSPPRVRRRAPVPILALVCAAIFSLHAIIY